MVGVVPGVRRLRVSLYFVVGRSAAIAALQAYLADCSSPATRSAFVPQPTGYSFKPDTADHNYSRDFSA